MNWFSKSADAVELGKLLVTIAAASTGATGLGIAAAGCDAYLSAHKRLARTYPDLNTLAAEVSARLEKRLAQPDFHMPDGAPILLAQMLEQALPSPDAFNRHDLTADRILDEMVGELTDPEHRKPEMVQAFRDLYAPVLHDLCDDPRLTTILEPQLRQEDRRILRDMQQRLGSLETGLSNPGAITRAELEALCRNFGIEGARDLSDAKLTDLLGQKAEEYRTFKNMVDGIDDRVAGLGNLKASAKDAMERLDFAEVEDLLAQVDEVETEIVCESKELRGRNALLRGRADEAYRHFCAAADAWANVDVLKPARMRVLRFAEPLGRHGMRYGGPGLSLSVKIVGPALTEDVRDKQPKDWAAGQNAKAIGLHNLAARTEGAHGADLLAEAAQACRAALTVRTPNDHAVECATTQNNLANALSDQAMRTEGEEGTALRADAIIAYDQALTVYTPEDYPVDWAGIQNNLANTLRDQAARSEGVAKAKLLAEAVQAYRDALTVRTREDYPVDWAGTQNNLANALSDQTMRAEGEAAADLREQAMKAYRAALTVRTQEDHPVGWAMTQHNLAILEKDWAQRPKTEEARAHWQAALGHVDKALEVFEPEHMGFYHAKATKLREEILAVLEGS